VVWVVVLDPVSKDIVSHPVGVERAAATGFEAFAVEVRPRLIRALVPVRGIEGAADAASEARAYAWEHWEQVRVMSNPAGFLYRVASHAGHGLASTPTRSDTSGAAC
jgi:hypothetical protein